jgi:hypothetical protein
MEPDLISRCVKNPEVWVNLHAEMEYTRDFSTAIVNLRGRWKFRGLAALQADGTLCGTACRYVRRFS